MNYSLDLASLLALAPQDRAVQVAAPAPVQAASVLVASDGFTYREAEASFNLHGELPTNGPP